MAAIRSKGNKSTEQALRYRLVRAGIRGWHMLDPDVLGKPDFIFEEAGLVLFVDGCYWHGCPKCYRAPSSNQTYWAQKLIRNRGRDRFVTKQLRGQGWQVVRIWEHELKRRPGAVLKKIQKLISPPMKAFSATAG
jgi:DNA mismatch endonuclease (patch repair protein)